MSWEGTEVALIWAQTPTGVIGVRGEIPWHVPEDFAHFKAHTMGAPVVMGRATWDSLPERSRPLPGRRNIVVTRNADAVFDGAERAASLEEALTLATLEAPERVWVIGGGQIYAQALEWADRLEVTLVDAPVVDGDAYAPQITDDWVGSQPDGETVWLESRTGLRYAFTRYTRR